MTEVQRTLRKYSSIFHRTQAMMKDASYRRTPQGVARVKNVNATKISFFNYFLNVKEDTRIQLFVYKIPFQNYLLLLTKT